MSEVNKDGVNLGIVKISDEVISVVAAVASSEIKGVVEIGHCLVSANNKFSKKGLGKGVKVSVDNEEAIIEMAISVEYGIKISDLVYKVQDNVKNTVQAITGLKVSMVNIYVQNIVILKDKNEILDK